MEKLADTWGWAIIIVFVALVALALLIAGIQAAVQRVRRRRQS